jgi:ASCH domain
MKTLSIRQPWASLIIYAGKTVENRTWRTTYRGPLLIHAGRRRDPAGFSAIARMGIEIPELYFGGIIGRVQLVDIVEDSASEWAIAGQHHWILEEPEPLPFTPSKGRLGLYDRRLAAGGTTRGTSLSESQVI